MWQCCTLPCSLYLSLSTQTLADNPPSELPWTLALILMVKSTFRLPRRSVMADARKDEINNGLDTLLSRQCHLEAKLRGITKVLPSLQIVHSDAQKLAEMVTFTSTLAENVSAKVRRLDIARIQGMARSNGQRRPRGESAQEIA
ncbi:uncharacterized protein [Periplaneta americana]|uniref:uncharacterized protein n=1 Tax=Periplaneta americana TaxID=6978 RepID=UPI0037E974AE